MLGFILHITQHMTLLTMLQSTLILVRIFFFLFPLVVYFLHSK